jgi:hypothetical protein
MDLMQQLGGRKFLALLIILAAGIYLALVGKLSAEAVTLLLGSLSSFSIANYAVTKEHMHTRAKTGDLDQVLTKIDEIHARSTDQESMDQLGALLNNLNHCVSDVKASQASLGTAVINSIKRG